MNGVGQACCLSEIVSDLCWLGRFMSGTGILGPDDRTELIDGDIIFMAPMGTRHASCIGRLLEIFFQGLGKLVSILSQTPVRLNGGLEPQPDLSILKRREVVGLGLLNFGS